MQRAEEGRSNSAELTSTNGAGSLLNGDGPAVATPPQPTQHSPPTESSMSGFSSTSASPFTPGDISGSSVCSDSPSWPTACAAQGQPVHRTKSGGYRPTVRGRGRAAQPVGGGAIGGAGVSWGLDDNAEDADLHDAHPMMMMNSAADVTRSFSKIVSQLLMALCGGKHDATTISSVLAGLICGLIFFVFCCVFSSMIFGQNAALIGAVPLGIGIHTVSTLAASIVFARYSGCKAVMAGPDINPTVFMAEMAEIISYHVCGSDGVLGVDNPYILCDSRRAIATTLMGMIIGTLLVGISFRFIGRKKLTTIAGYIPASVVSGFLSCIGYKVLKAAIEVASPEVRPLKSYTLHLYVGSWERSWLFLLPPLPIGLPLYFLKRWHFGNPTVTFPVFIVVPFVTFYLAIYLSGATIDEARLAGWFFPKTETSMFWRQYETMYVGIFDGHVEWPVLLQVIPTWLVMLLIVNLDNMLKLASTESALEIDFDYNHEMKVGGTASIVNAFLLGSPAYGQTKFNVLNYGITHSTTSPIATYVCGAFCGALFITGLPLINYLPRFCLAGLLLFAATGFLIENLWDARRKFSKLDYCAIWAVFLINMGMSEVYPTFGLLLAIFAGLIFSAFTFAYKFAQKSSAVGDFGLILGSEHSSLAVRSAALELRLGKLGSWYTILTASDYVFFGTASKLYKIFKEHLQAQREQPPWKRCKIVIVNMYDVYGIDATAASVFAKLARLAQAERIQLVFAGLSASVEKRLTVLGMLQGLRFDDPDVAEKWAEDTLLLRAHTLVARWLVDPNTRLVYNKAMLHDALASTSHVSDGALGPAQLLKWGSKRLVPRGAIAAAGADDHLYLLYRGEVHVIEGGQRTATVYPGAFFNERVVVVGGEGAAYGQAGIANYAAMAVEDSVMLVISRRQRELMRLHDPHAAYALLTGVVKQMDKTRQPARRGTSQARLDINLAGTGRNSKTRANERRGHGGRNRGERDAHMIRAKLLKAKLVRRDAALRRTLHAALGRRRASASTGSLKDLNEASGASAVSAEPSAGQGPVYGLGDEAAAGAWLVDEELLRGDDYVVPLTHAQREHYARIFELVDHASSGYIHVADLSKFIESAGQGVPTSELMTMVREVGIEDDGRGAISLPDFLQFVRLTLISDLPARKVSMIERAFAATALTPETPTDPATGLPLTPNKRSPRASLDLDHLPMLPSPSMLPAAFMKESDGGAAPVTPMTPGGTRVPQTPPELVLTALQAAEMLRSGGFELDDGTLESAFAEVAAGTGAELTLEQMIATVGVLKRHLLETAQLETSFTLLCSNPRSLARRSTGDAARGEGSSWRPPKPKRAMSTISRLERATRGVVSPSKSAGDPWKRERGEAGGDAADGEGRRKGGSARRDELVCRASDLMHGLGIGRTEAEEMIYLADMDGDGRSIDFTEFCQTVLCRSVR